MTDKEQIIEELKKNIQDKDIEDQKLLFSICDELFKEIVSPTAVSELLQGKIKPIKIKFDDAYNRLLKKMGL